MTSTVIPGQYIKPAYDIADGVVERYYPSKGTTVSLIEVGTKKIPVVVATVLGKVVITDVSETLGKEGKSFMVSVATTNSYVNHDEEIKNLQLETSLAINLPKENDIVLVKVTKMTSKQAYCEILSVEGFGNVLHDSGIGANAELAHVSVAPGAGSQPFASVQTVASSQTTMVNAASNDLGENFKGIIRSQDVRSTDRDKVKIIECFKPGDIVRALILSLGDGLNYYLTTARNDLGVLFAKSQGGSGDWMFPVDWQNMVDKRSGVVEKRKCAKPFQ